MDLALNNLQRLICHKTHQTELNPFLGKGRMQPFLHLSIVYCVIYAIIHISINRYIYYQLKVFGNPKNNLIYHPKSVIFTETN